MKDALKRYGFDPKNICFKQYKDIKYTVKLTKQQFKEKHLTHFMRVICE